MGKTNGILANRAVFQWAVRADAALHDTTSQKIAPLAAWDRFNTDWAWRPDIWRKPLTLQAVRAQGATRLDPEVAVFHDGQGSAPTLHQTRNSSFSRSPPYGVSLCVDRFDGDYVSFAVDLPKAAIARLSPRHIIEAKAVIEMDKPTRVFFRLNIRHGPNTAKILWNVPFGQQDITAPFELAFTPFQVNRVEKAWVDVIFEQPRTNRITLRDLTFSRHPRAEI